MSPLNPGSSRVGLFAIDVSSRSYQVFKASSHVEYLGVPKEGMLLSPDYGIVDRERQEFCVVRMNTCQTSAVTKG